MLTRIWLTYKQHRFETIAIVVVCLGLAAAALIEAYRLNSINVPLKCLESWQGGHQMGPYPQGPIDAATQHCNDLAQTFSNIKTGMDAGLVGMLLVFAPLLVGIIFGAPIVAREIETGTAPLSWALSGSRRRWLLGKVLAGVLLIVPLMLVVGLAADVFEGAQYPDLNVHASYVDYVSRGAIVVFWALAAFAGTFALGTLMGRTMPAVIVALVVCFFVRGSWEAGMNHFVLRPFAVEAPLATDANYTPNSWFNDIALYQVVYMDGKPWDGDVDAWWLAHQQVQVSATPDASGSVPGGGAPVYIDPATNKPLPPSQIPTYVNFMIPGAWYWNVVALESGLLLLGSLFCGAVAFVWVDRRRPY
jgi:hypothetical protein